MHLRINYQCKCTENFFINIKILIFVEIFSAMDAKTKYAIVIGRQFGAGGKALGAELAKRLGIRCYDKTLLSRAAESLGFRKELMANADERKPSIFRSFLNCNPGIANEQIAGSPMHGDSLYKIQSEVITKLAERESCIFVGRTADYVLREHPCMVSVFLHADRAHRIDRICKRGDADYHSAPDILNKRDRERQKYYNYYTGRKWGDSATYDITLNASGIPIDKLASIVIEYLNCKAGCNVNKI